MTVDHDWIEAEARRQGIDLTRKDIMALEAEVSRDKRNLSGTRSWLDHTVEPPHRFVFAMNGGAIEAGGRADRGADRD